LSPGWRVLVLAALAAAGLAAPAAGQRFRAADRYDDHFRKYSKRFFGPAFDWRLFKAQALAESGLDSSARSQVGAEGVMQLMPSTQREIASRNPEMQRIDAVEWNVAAGIAYDRALWRLWAQDSVDQYRREFMLASYNAGRRTILIAQRAAKDRQLDHRAWSSIETIAPAVTRWRYRETVDYVKRIEVNLSRLDDRGRLSASSPVRPEPSIP